MTVDANKPDFLIVCTDSKFLLPIYEEALTKTAKSIRFIKYRYEGALMINNSGEAQKIINICQIDSGFSNRFLCLIGLKQKTIRCQTKYVERNLTDLLKIISSVVVDGDSYSVWAQFYDSSDDLENAVISCDSMDKLLKVLHIECAGEVSYELV
jgi:hypothetical protein